MSYQVLARKWRPKTFQEMVGQAPILRMLANALQQKRIHHAYLFTGTRGVGKTTLARIFAKSLNCETGVTHQPCGICQICTAIDEGRFLDLYEVDAASRTKVEDTRDLLENVCYPPNQGRYKVYLIDEVHMLSNHSFNALLKTLEEPPEHVKFILATTDPKRLPITILSRCLQFHLKRLPEEQIAQRLEQICQAEAIQFETVAINKLAEAADGSMRDALSLLDQAVAFGCGKVNNDDVYAMLGSLSQDDVLPLINALANQNGAELFTAINTLAERGPDFEQVLTELINVLHKLSLHHLIPDSINLTNAWQDCANKLNPEDIQLYYQIALLGRRDLTYAASPRQGFEMTMLRMFAFQPDSQKKTSNLKGSANTIVEEIATEVEIPHIAIQTPKVNTTNATEELASQQQWREIISKLSLSGLAHALATNCTLLKWENNKLQLALSVTHQPMLNEKLKERIAEAISKHLNQAIHLEIVTTNEDLITPSKHAYQEEQEQLSKAKEKIMKDPILKKLIDIYDATVEVSLI